MSGGEDEDLSRESDALFERLRPTLEKLTRLATRETCSRGAQYLALQRVLASVAGSASAVRGNPCADDREKLEAGAFELDLVARMLREERRDNERGLPN
jgi:hypothetical protein